MAFDTDPADTAQAKAHSTLLRLALPAYTVHFKSPTYLQIHTLDLIDNKCSKPILKETAGNTILSVNIRENLARDGGYWAEMVELVGAGVRGLERRSFSDARGERDGVDYESTSGALIASNYPGLWKDLERLNTLLSISRNILTVGPLAQNNALSYSLSQQIFKLINCCVRVTARGYDGDTSGAGGGPGAGQEEERWQWVVNAYKKLLITCLQWLNNLVAGNEGGKVVLWGELFDEDGALDEEEDDVQNGEVKAEEQQQSKEVALKSRDLSTKKKNEPPKKPSPPITNHDILLAYGTNGSSRISPLELEGAIPLNNPPPAPKPNSTSPPPPLDRTGFKPLPSQIQALAKKNHYDANGYVYFTARHKGRAVEIYQEKHGRSPTLAEIHLAMPVLWEEERLEKGVGGKKQWELWQGGYDRAVREFSEVMEGWERGLIEGVDKKAIKAEEEEVVEREPERKVERRKPKKINIEAKIAGLEEKFREELEGGEWMGGHYLVDQRQSKDMEAPTSAQQQPPQISAAPSAPKHFLQEKDKDNTQLVFDAQAGIKILESGKAELMKRLEGFAEEDQLPVNKDDDGRGGGRDSGVGDVRRRRRKERRDLDLADAFAEMGGDVREMPHGRRKESDRSDVQDEDKATAADAEERLKAEVLGPDASQVTNNHHNDIDGDHRSSNDDDSEDDDDDDDESEDEEEDYPGSSEDGRGLLTDVPLILGPSEIEVLPMLVMSGIYPSNPSNTALITTNGPSPAPGDLSPLTLHILLTRTPGLNLLRELLIFVAAWDLREEELYFKFMVKIIEKVMERGLLPWLYWSLRDRSRSRDVISPAQAVVLKLGTGLVRGRRGANITTVTRGEGGELDAHEDTSSLTNPARPPPGPATMPSQMMTKTDLHLLNFLFSEFRQHIIPQTCALIFLQGQIHRGRASAEDFPLNLWDMERMYEGVYQVLEWFAVAVEEPRRGGIGPAAAAATEKEDLDRDRDGGEDNAGVTWKGILSEWEMASELITLLRELESGIPKLSAAPPPAATGSVPAATTARKAASDLRPGQEQRSLSADDIITLPPPPAALNAERSSDADANLSASQRIFEAETPLAYPEEQQQASSTLHPTNPAPASAAAPPPPTTLHDQDEPSDFEWRNLKKLTVLVLSSLIWKNKPVQDQVRRFGGLEALVAACRPDEHNPYLREHAIMCLRFAVEGNEENAGVIRDMAREFAGGAEEGVERIGKEGQRSGYRYVREDGRNAVAGERLVDDDVEFEEEISRGGFAGEKRMDDIPGEVLDQGKYETFLDRKGQVGLRRKSDNASLTPDGQDRSATASAPPIPSLPHDQKELLASLTSGSAQKKAASDPLSGAVTSWLSNTVSTTKMTAEKAAELMQNALRDLPLGEKLVTDRQKAEALARLDRAFERTERSLGVADAGASGDANGASGGKQMD